MIITKLHIALVRTMKPYLALNAKAGKGMWSSVRMAAFHEGEDWLDALAKDHGVTREVMQQAINDLPTVFEILIEQVTNEQLTGGWQRAGSKWIKNAEDQV